MLPIPRRHRTLWISDVHLGTRGSQADLLVDFLTNNRAETIYLVGDIVDGWRLRRNWYWPASHDALLKLLLDRVQEGCRVVFIPGNHDEFGRSFIDHSFAGIEVKHQALHRTADGRRLLIIHGDEFDVVVRYARWLALVGDKAYGVALWLNRWFNKARMAFGYPYWSLSAFLKLRVKNAVQFISEFETALSDVARRAGADGVVCGHIHHPEIRDIDGTLYCNCGDWVESCTALAEDETGRIRLINWTQPLGATRIDTAKAKEAVCASSSSATLGILRSMALFGRSRPSPES